MFQWKQKKVPKAFIICKGFVSNKVLSHFQNKANVKTQVAELLSFDFFFFCVNIILTYFTKQNQRFSGVKCDRFTLTKPQNTSWCSTTTLKSVKKANTKLKLRAEVRSITETWRLSFQRGDSLRQKASKISCKQISAFSTKKKKHLQRGRAREKMALGVKSRKLKGRSGIWVEISYFITRIFSFFFFFACKCFLNFDQAYV